MRTPTGPSRPVTQTITRTLEWIDTDAGRRHHNSVIMRWVEACEIAWWKDHDLLEVFTRAPRVQQVVNYTAPIYFDQDVEITVELAQLGRTSVTFSFEAAIIPNSLQESRTVVAHGSFTVVNLSPDGQRAHPWPEHVRTSLLR
jgi:acyl-CoA thioester hydrolase